MIRFGYFSDQVPACFNTDDFSANYSILMKSCKKEATVPVQLSMYKNETSRRVLSFPNPQSYLFLVKTLSDNLEYIEESSKSKNSQSKIFQEVNYSSFENKVICSNIMSTFLKIKSKYREALFEKIRLALGYRYCLSIDISHFYDSIYSHAITWAMAGKEKAKSMFYQKTKKSNYYQIAEKNDRDNCLINGKETNGILVGPYSSRIFSEILLARIDQILRDQNYVFVRYVDDYSFYFKKPYDAETKIADIEGILNDYRLQINESKTEITKFPFYKSTDLKALYKEEFKKNGLIGVLQLANNLQLDKEKGAYKYALKFLKDKDYSCENPEVALSYLINILLIKPDCGLLAVDAIQKLKSFNNGLHLKDISDTINIELKDCLNNKFEQEALLLSYLLQKIDAKISFKNIVLLMESKNDFLCLMALNYLCNHKKMITSYDENNAKNCIEELCDNIKGQTYQSKHWLLLYESKRNNFFANQNFSYPDDDFFKKMEDLQISFFSKF